jgi:acetyl-CoA carboxylase biotin carboxyl carrier protein
MSTEHEGSREEPMSDAGLVDERPLVEPVAVGPGDPARNGAAASDAPFDAPFDGAPAPAAVDGGTPEDGGIADAAGAPVPAVALNGADASLLALVDRLTMVLERSDLGELEVAAGGTTIVLRAPSAIERHPAAGPAPADGAAAALAPDGPPVAAAVAAPPAARPSVKAPLTGIFYGAPSPGAMPYVAVGDHVAVGQIIGLIEAMKLFNEIKSDLAGRVVRVCADNGALVKARQPLIEVEPA